MTMKHDSPEKTPAWPQRGRYLLAAAAIGILAFGAGAVVFAPPGKNVANRAAATQEARAPTTSTAPAGTTALPPRMLEQGAPFSFADLVEHVRPAVVAISVEREEQMPAVDLPDNLPEPFRQFFEQYGKGKGKGIPRTLRGQTVGSGFIISSDGYIVTNNHLVANGKKISVKLNDGREFEAKLLGADSGTDVALLKAEGVKNLPTVAFGDDRQLRVGDWVVAVGNPFGLGGTVTAGIVSSIGRDIGSGPYTDYIQIDAPINRGNSGGPTFDLTGRVVGMNTAIFSPSGGSVGIGFAVPASTVQEIVDQLRSKGSVARGWLGVQIQSLTPDMAASLGVPNAKGAIVARVVPQSPAAAAGFKQGDVVLTINGKEVEDSRDLTRRVGALPAGTKATFTVLRGGKEEKITAAITKRDESKLAANEPRGEKPQPTATDALGLALVALTPDAKRYYGVGESLDGVLIASVDPDSEAASKGLQAGEVITSVGTKRVSTPREVEQAIKEAKTLGRDKVLLFVAGQQGERYVALKLAQS